MSQSESPPHRFAPSSVPYVLLAASLVMILAIVGYLIWVAHVGDRLRFQNQVQKAVNEIELRPHPRHARALHGERPGHPPGIP